MNLLSDRIPLVGFCALEMAANYEIEAFKCEYIGQFCLFNGVLWVLCQLYYIFDDRFHGFRHSASNKYSIEAKTIVFKLNNYHYWIRSRV